MPAPIFTLPAMGCFLLGCSLRRELESQRPPTCRSDISWRTTHLCRGSWPEVNNLGKNQNGRAISPPRVVGQSSLATYRIGQILFRSLFFDHDLQMRCDVFVQFHRNCELTQSLQRFV